MLRMTINVTVYDPQVIDALERLAPLRKSGAFTVEALKYFLRSEEGQGILAEMAGPVKVLLSGQRGSKNSPNASSRHNDPFPSETSQTVTVSTPLAKGGIDLDVIMGGGRR